MGQTESLGNQFKKTSVSTQLIQSESEYDYSLVEALPEELIILMLSYVDNRSLLKCRLVCKNWNEIITSTLIWKEKCRRSNVTHTPNGVTWLAYYALFTGHVFDKNLLLNNCGQQQLQYWRVEQNGGDRFKVENPPEGSDPIPNESEFNGCNSCFVTSYGECSKYQIIKLSKLQKKIMDELQPEIYISEWFAGRFDCGCIYNLNVWFVNNEQKVLHQISDNKMVQQWEGSKWSKVELKYNNYPKGISEIRFSHSGHDTQFWAGHYGSKFSGGVVKMFWNSIKSV